MVHFTMEEGYFDQNGNQVGVIFSFSDIKNGVCLTTPF